MDGRVFRAMFCAGLALCSAARADKTNNEWHTTIRAATMGNVGITTAEDSATAMFYNPALLARQRKINLEFFNPVVEMGFGNLTIAGKKSDYNRQMTLKNAYPLLRGHRNKVSSYRAAIYPNFFAQNFSFGVLGSAQSQASLPESRPSPSRRSAPKGAASRPNCAARAVSKGCLAWRSKLARAASHSKPGTLSLPSVSWSFGSGQISSGTSRVRRTGSRRGWVIKKCTIATFIVCPITEWHCLTNC
ncbi:MAG: hypothetical protein HUU37_00685 [Bdellovibrionales bacterium]|nr:hypothetical protein [Bdellovibrionales bacterium]